MSQKAIVEKMRINQQSVSRSLVSMEKKNVLKKIKGGYMVNPDFVIKEYEKFHTETIARWVR